MKVFRIYINGEKTNYIYQVETEEEALKEYEHDYIWDYRMHFGHDPYTKYIGDVRAKLIKIINEKW